MCETSYDPISAASMPAVLEVLNSGNAPSVNSAHGEDRRKRPQMPRKRRTRQHVIAEQSANHVERHILLSGYSVERVEHDYGIDLILFTYDERGEIENGQVFIQLKATDNLRVSADQRTFTFAVQRSDLELWLQEPMPCILIVYDAQADVAYWLYVQAYFESQAGFALHEAPNAIAVHLPTINVVEQSAIRRFARWRDDVLKQVEGVIRHHA